MLILQLFGKHLSSSLWLVPFIVCPRDKCKEAGFVGSCFIFDKFFQMLRVVY